MCVKWCDCEHATSRRGFTDKDARAGIQSRNGTSCVLEWPARGSEACLCQALGCGGLALCHVAITERDACRRSGWRNVSHMAQYATSVARRCWVGACLLHIIVTHRDTCHPRVYKEGGEVEYSI